MKGRKTEKISKQMDSQSKLHRKQALAMNRVQELHVHCLMTLSVLPCKWFLSDSFLHSSHSVLLCSQDWKETDSLLGPCSLLSPISPTGCHLLCHFRYPKGPVALHPIPQLHSIIILPPVSLPLLTVALVSFSPLPTLPTHPYPQLYLRTQFRCLLLFWRTSGISCQAEIDLYLEFLCISEHHVCTSHRLGFSRTKTVVHLCVAISMGV